MSLRRSTFVLVMCAGLMSLSACAAGPAPGTSAGAGAGEMPPRPAAINHFVVFKLLDPADADELIADCDEHLAGIPGVVSYFAGRHHEVGRPTVYSDYDVGFFVGFDCDEAYAAYVDHPAHVMVVEKWRPRWEWIRVYDVFDDGSRQE